MKKTWYALGGIALLLVTAILFVALAAPAAARGWQGHMRSQDQMYQSHMCAVDGAEIDSAMGTCAMGDPSMHRSMMGSDMMGDMDRHQGTMRGMHQSMMGSGMMGQSGECHAACDPALMEYHRDSCQEYRNQN
jgi:hypothetical protein